MENYETWSNKRRILWLCLRQSRTECPNNNTQFFLTNENCILHKKTNNSITRIKSPVKVGIWAYMKIVLFMRASKQKLIFLFKKVIVFFKNCSFIIEITFMGYLLLSRLLSHFNIFRMKLFYLILVKFHRPSLCYRNKANYVDIYKRFIEKCMQRELKLSVGLNTGAG